LDWLYEIKFDGYRCLAGKDAGGVSLWSRRGNNFTAQFPAIAKACEYLPDGTLVDGEVAAFMGEGAPAPAEGRIVTIAADRLRVALPRTFAAGSTTGVLFATLPEGDALSNAVTFILP